MMLLATGESSCPYSPKVLTCRSPPKTLLVELHGLPRVVAEADVGIESRAHRSLLRVGYLMPQHASGCGVAGARSARRRTGTWQSAQDDFRLPRPSPGESRNDRLLCRISVPRPGGDHRRRRDRELGRLSPGQGRLDRCRPARARPADVGHDVARRRPDDVLRLVLRDVDGDAPLHPSTSTASSRQRRDSSTGFKAVGFIEAAADEDRLEEYRRVAAFNRMCGLDVHEISPAEIDERFPIADTTACSPASTSPMTAG